MLTSIPAPETMEQAVDRLNDIVAAIGAHRRLGKYDAESLLDRIEDDARDIRNMLETGTDPGG